MIDGTRLQLLGIVSPSSSVPALPTCPACPGWPWGVPWEGRRADPASGAKCLVKRTRPNHRGNEGREGREF